MKALIQRVTRASVTIDGAVTARIGKGLLVLVGVEVGDEAANAEALAEKVLRLRIFPGDGKPMNVAVADAAGEVLVVSQFTLAADTGRGNRPGFSSAAAPELAAPLVERFAAVVRERLGQVQTGTFGAAMAVELVNDGPVTFLLEK